MKKQIFLILTLITFLFASCSNIFEDSISNAESSSASSTDISDNGKESVKYIAVTGSINLEGAYPQEILNQVQDTSSSNRTAFPTAPTLSGLTLSVKAVNTSNSADTINGEIISETNNGSYRINIPVSSPAKEYEIHITASQTWGEVLSGKSEAFTISQSSPVTEKNVTLKAIQSEGVGTFNLRVGISTNVGNNIQSGIVTYHPTPQTISSYPFSKSSNICTIKKGTIGTDEITNGLACGSYLMTFDFYSGPVVNSAVTGNLVYSFKQTVNIFKGLETNTWVKNGSEPYLTVSGGTTTCTITKALVDSFAREDFWVKSSGSETASGSFFNPLGSIEQAVARMNNPDIDYKIHVIGQLNGTQAIPSSLTTANAHSVTILGETGLNESGQPQDSINGNFGDNADGYDDGFTFDINGNVPISIKNLLITGGNNNTTGGGILNSGELTLLSGCVVSGNKAGLGGGIYNNAKLTITSGAVISDNEATGNEDDEGGGGIYNYNGTVIMSGGQIKSNTAKNGGGIYSIIDDQTEELTVVYIYGDAVIGGDTTADRNSAVVGGGIYNHGGLIYFGCTGYSVSGAESSAVYYNPDTSKSLAWTGKISHNSATQRGGGIYSRNSLSVSTYKGTGLMFVLSGTISSNSAANGGGVFFENGSQFTLYGGKIGGDTSADGNTATAVGGGINAQGKCYLKGGTVSYNTASDGGGIYAANGPIISSGTIKNNSATYNGGAIYVNAMCTYLGDAYIPVGSDKKNDVYIYTANSAYITLSDLNPPAECTDGIVATITPGSYSSGTTVVTFKDTVTEEQKPGLVSKFAVKQDSSTPNTFWKINSSGNLESSIVVSADNAASAIQAMTASGSVTITGSISDEQFTAIAEKVKNLGTGVNINLDLSQTDITSIPDDLFTGADKLTAITFPSTLENIGESSFKNCLGLTSITIPDSVTMVRNYAFDGCENISSYTLPNNDSVVYQNKIFSGWNLTELVVTKGSMTGSAVIANIESLYTVTLPANLGNYPIFYNCPNVKIIHYLGTREQWENKCSTWFSNNSPSLLDLTTITFIDD